MSHLQNPARDKSVVCVVEDPRDVAAIERTHEYNGTYHVLLALSRLWTILVRTRSALRNCWRD